MIVKELLLNALANAGHIGEGDKTAEFDDIELALRKFNFELRRLSNRNLITAFQKVVDVTNAKAEQVVGGFTAKKNHRVKYCKKATEIPNASDVSLVVGKDFILCGYDTGTENDGFKLTLSNGAKVWTPCNHNEFIDIMPDVVCLDMERVITAMFKNSYGRWETLRYVPLAAFYTEDDDYIYCASQGGENKVNLVLPSYVVGKDVRLIYNSSMDFDKNDVLELPDAHIALMELATTVAILTKDGDADQSQLDKFQAQLDSLMQDIMANTASERKLLRRSEGVDTLENLRSGRFIRGRYR